LEGKKVNSTPTKSTLKKEIIGFGLLALLFLFITFHRPIFELFVKFDENQWYEGMAVIIDSHVKDVVNDGKSSTHTYYVYAHYQYESFGTTYESNSISHLGDYIIANDRSDAYDAINTYLKPEKYIEVNISRNPPKRSYLFRDKLPDSSNRKEIAMFVIALLALFGLNKSIKQLRAASHKQKTHQKENNSSQPISYKTLDEA
jgi:hypothetical protein